MMIYVKDENGKDRMVKAIYKGSEDGTPVKMEEDTPEYFAAAREAAMQGMLTYGT